MAKSLTQLYRRKRVTDKQANKLKETSTHKSAKTLDGNVFVTRDLDL